MIKLLQKNVVKLDKEMWRWKEVRAECVERMREAPEGRGKEGEGGAGGVYSQKVNVTKV